MSERVKRDIVEVLEIRIHELFHSQPPRLRCAVPASFGAGVEFRGFTLRENMLDDLNVLAVFLQFSLRVQ